MENSQDKIYFPLFINLENKKVLVIGAGKIAYRKVETLLKYGADIYIVSREIAEEKFCNLKNIQIFIGEFKEDMLKDTFLVIAATDNKEFNRYIFELCSKKNILVNNITSKTKMNCRFGSIIDTDEYLIGISAKGNPKKAKNMREKLEKILTLE